MKKRVLFLFKLQISLLVFFTLQTIQLQAQKIEKVIFVVFDNSVVINYDLVGGSADSTYDVGLFVSTSAKGEYKPIPSLELTGDFGFGIRSGVSKSIQWQPAKSLDYPAVSFQVKASFFAKDAPIEQKKVVSNTKVVPIEEKKKETDFMDMILVDGGTFQMGSNDGNTYGTSPMHQVKVNSFYIGKYEVTQKQWLEIMVDKPSFFKGCDSCPVEYVSWEDVQRFIEKLNSKTKKTYRLPTEAEWEFAARGGAHSKSFAYSGSDSIEDVAWYRTNSGDKTQEVGKKKANELGIFDMTGNVWEWCSDWSGKYEAAPQVNPKGVSSGTSHVIRGGAWNSGSPNSRVLVRNSSSPKQTENNIGFRLVYSLHP